MELHTIGIDLGKTVFHLVGLNPRGEVVVRKRYSRAQLLRFTANRQVHLIGMEACGGAHFLGRALREQGHEVRLIPAQYVKPFVKTNKSDFIDAEAIAEAVPARTGVPLPCAGDDQPPPSGRAAAGLRGRRYRAAQPRPGRRDSAREGRQADRRAARKLADRRAEPLLATGPRRAKP